MSVCGAHTVLTESPARNRSDSQYYSYRLNMLAEDKDLFRNWESEIGSREWRR